MFVDNLEKACASKGLKISPILKELDISTGNLSRWKKGGAVSSDTILALAERLDVTTDFLLTGKAVSSSSALYCADQNEERLLSMYRELSGRQKERLFSYIQGMYDSVEHEQGEKSAV